MYRIFRAGVNVVVDAGAASGAVNETGVLLPGIGKTGV